MAGIRDLEDVVPRLKEVSDSLEEMSETVATAYRAARAATKSADPYPKAFVGKIKGYRFTSGGVGIAPSHRYEVACGNGIVLHMETGMVEFAAALTGMSMGEITPAKLNGTLVVVSKEPEGLKLVSMVPDGKVFPVYDRWGNYLYEGAPIVSTTYGRDYRAKSLSTESSVVIEKPLGSSLLVVSPADLALDVDAL